jgi:hypothetical protein
MGGGDAAWSPASTGAKSSNSTAASFMNKLGSVFNSEEAEPAYSGHPGSGHDTPFGQPTAGSGGANHGNNGYYVSPYRTSQVGEVFSTTTSSGMQGFGSAPVEPAMDGRSLAAKAAQGLAALASTVTSAASSATSSSAKDFGYVTNRGPNAFGQSNSYTPSSQTFSKPQSGFNANSTNVWGNAASQSSVVASMEPGAAMPGSIVPDIPRHSSGVGRAGGAQSDGSYERSMIEGLCESGGLKVVPPEDKLDAFLIAAQTLSPDLVGPCLIDELNSESWQSRTKALIVVAALAKAKGCFAHSAWWVGQSDTIRAMGSDVKTSVRTQALKCMRALKIPSSITAPGAGNSGLVANVDNSDEALLIDDGPSEIISANSLRQPLQNDMFAGMNTNVGVSKDDCDGLFSGLSVSSGSPEVPSRPPQFAEYSVPNSAPVPVAPPAGVFDFLSDVGTTVEPQQPPPPVPVPQSSFGFLSSPSQPQHPFQVPSSNFDFMTSSTTAQTFGQPPAQQQNTNDLFGNMTVNNSQTNAVVTPSQNPNYVSDFMGLDASPLGVAMFDAYSKPSQPIMYNSTVMFPAGNMHQPQQQQQQQYQNMRVQQANLNLSQSMPPAPVQNRQQPPFGAPVMCCSTESILVCNNCVATGVISEN